jgi:hypothetical protein
MPPPGTVLCLIRRAQRYQRWHDDPAISARTNFFAAAAVVNRVLARHALLPHFLLELGAVLEEVNSRRALEIRAGNLYCQDSVWANTLDFVRYEQGIVQTHLDSLHQSSPLTYRREIRVINTVLAVLRCSVLGGFAGRCFVRAVDETLRCLGGPLDFATLHCRVMLGAQLARHATATRSKREA